ncbi:hypothetical protein K1719_045789 [Acacia pycnantha]|nr:hypothetical protein K1719_045789 [Acacia pycnantha]
MESILSKAWNLQSGFEVTEITGNTFLFKFRDEEDFSRVLRVGVRFGFKLQMHNIPLEALCLENAITIWSHVEEVILAEDPRYNGRYLRNFLRARAILDLRKPLAYGFWLPRPDGRKIRISVKYEKLQTFCYNCGKVGHDNRVCQSAKLMSSFNGSEPRGQGNERNSWQKHDEDVSSSNAQGMVSGINGAEEVILQKEKKVHSDEAMVQFGFNAGLGIVEEAKDESWPGLDSSDSGKTAGTQPLLGADNPMAMVLYSGQEVTNVIDGLCHLGLKRSADDSWEAGKLKRRKECKEVGSPLRDISNFANNLKNVKAKIRRSGRRKGSLTKEIGPT